MRILYLGVHQVLEYDELRMFRDGGHQVFSLGGYFESPPVWDIRPPLDLGPEWQVLRERFEALNGRYAVDPGQCVIPAAFVDFFDVCIVMHEVGFLEHHWETLSRIPVIWRTIGVDPFGADRRIRPFRDRGCFIVRYSPVEKTVPDYAGTDAFIRFPKKLSDFAPWTGSEATIVKFYSALSARLPAEYAVVQALAEGRRFIMGGAGNDDCPGAIGPVSPARQSELLKTSRVYFYGAGPPCPYTLNFMEAWLAGIPVVALKPELIWGAEASRFTEIPRLIAHGRDGFIADSVEEAGALCDRLLGNHELARRIGARGARKAAALFGDARIAGQWDGCFNGLRDGSVPVVRSGAFSAGWAPSSAALCPRRPERAAIRDVRVWGHGSIGSGRPSLGRAWRA